ncbi:MAG: response regulator [Bacteroidia bacterium]|nr:response regulator [Bacteroidia bacterium]MBT8292883.1 response regulator [Eudoraea sp.]NNF30109.1 response regulator [Flavobacteriaceae bacterium]MBT8274987.1 response regulator [Bacteroidia bacterium]NNJ80593.1 response regulator [Flavobacteriaceae bacterium]
MKKILLIEDNRYVRETTADILEFANYDVITAEDGYVGVRKAEEHLPDLILCDILMPALDGYEVLRILSENVETNHIPFIFLTSKTEKDDVRKGMILGADDYLLKPFEEHELLESIESRLRKKEVLINRLSISPDITPDLDDSLRDVNLEKYFVKYRTKLYNLKQDLFTDGSKASYVYYIKNGVVKTYKYTESGKEFVTGMYTSGEFIGQLSLLADESYNTETATAIADARTIEIPRTDFIDLMRKDKVISKIFTKMVSNELMKERRRNMSMAFASVRQRTAKALLELYNKGIVKDVANSGTDIPREDFAGFIGTATETAIRMLHKLKDEGLIAMGPGRKLILLNKTRLREIANFQ